MKKYWLIGLYALALTSCDSFLNCEPENSFSSEGFLESESDLRLYTNGFLQSFLPSEETIAWGGDQYADFCATRSSTTFLIGDTWDDTQQGGWGTGDWGDLRQINYFLDNLPNAKGKVTDAIYLHNEGVGRFGVLISIMVWSERSVMCLGMKRHWMWIIEMNYTNHVISVRL